MYVCMCIFGYMVRGVEVAACLRVVRRVDVREGLGFVCVGEVARALCRVEHGRGVVRVRFVEAVWARLAVEAWCVPWMLCDVWCGDGRL